MKMMVPVKKAVSILLLIAAASVTTDAFRVISTNPSPVCSSLFSSRAKPSFSSLITRVASTDHSSSSQGGETSSSSESGNSKSSDDSKSLLRTIDNVGLSLKPKAIKTSVKVTLEEKKSKKALLLLQTSLLYSLFILYRAYRGFFVILPAVFREVYRRVDAVIETPFDDSLFKSTDNNNSSAESDDRRWRVRITVGAVATVVTASYAISGAVRVLAKLGRTIWKTSDVSSSFAAAADEQESNENKIMLLTNRMKINGEGSSSSSDSADTTGLAP